MDILNNREWAILVWLTVLLLYMGFKANMQPVRVAAIKVLQCFFAWRIQSIIILALIYVSLVIYVLYQIELWHLGQIKDTLIWFVAVAFLSFFEIEKYKKDSRFFRDVVIDNIKLIALIEFLIGLYVFPLWAELILLPAATCITMMHVYSQTDRNHKTVETLLGNILAIIGLGLIAYSLHELIINFSDFTKLETAKDFLLPPLLTLTYLPFIFFMVIYTTYENIFSRLKFSVKNKWALRFIKTFSLIMFNLRIKELERWVWMLQVRNIATIRDVLQTWKDYKKMRKVEKKPPHISKNEGWSPYKAQLFLKDHGLLAGHYKKNHYDWQASAPSVDFGDEFIPANIAYYIKGSSNIAQSLKVAVNINVSKDGDIARMKKLEASKALYQQAVGSELPIEFQQAILDEKILERECPPFYVKFEKRIWPGHHLNGYELSFCISVLQSTQSKN